VTSTVAPGSADDVRRSSLPTLMSSLSVYGPDSLQHVSVRAPCIHLVSALSCLRLLPYLSSPAQQRETLPLGNGCTTSYQQATDHSMTFSLMATSRCVPLHPSGVCTHSLACIFCPTSTVQPSAPETLPLGNGCPNELPSDNRPLPLRP